MKKHWSKSVLSLLLALALMVSALPVAVFAETEEITAEIPEAEVLPETAEEPAERLISSCGENVTWEYKFDGVLTISGTGAMTEYTGNYNVPWSSYRDDIHTVIVEEGVTSLTRYAFYGFKNLTSVTLPESLLMIGNAAFYGCSGLETITLPTQLISLHSGAFQSSGLKEIVIPSSVTSLSNAVFQSCNKLTSVTLPNTLRSIGEYAFAACENLEEITIPSSVTNIYDWAFNGCTSLKSIILPSGLTKISRGVFLNCQNLAYVVIPSSVTSIDSWAFGECDGLWHVLFRGSETQWDAIPVGDFNTELNAAVCHCNAQGTEISVAPSSLDTCTAEALYKCSICQAVLTKPLEEPQHQWVAATCVSPKTCSACGATEGQNDPFGHDFGQYSCNSCYAYGGVCGENAYWVYDSTYRSVTIYGTGATYDFATYGAEMPPWSNRFITTLNVMEGITHLGNYAFYNRPLELVSLPGSLKSTGRYTFYGCSNLREIVLPEGFEVIGTCAFENCSRLESVTLPESLKEIGAWGFNSCTSLTTVTIPKNVDTIGISPFLDCDSLTFIYVDPESQYFCNDSSGVLYTKDMTTLWEAPSTLTGSFVIPETVKELGYCAFEGCGISDFTLPEGLEVIGQHAFRECVNLTEITIPDSVTEISHCAFWCDTKLTTVHMSENVTLIDSYAFQGCTSLTWIYLPATLTEIGYEAFNATPLKHILYGGTEEQWNAVTVDESNGHFGPYSQVTMHFEAQQSDIVIPTEQTNCAMHVDWSCEICGYIHGTEIEGGGHSWAAATCTEPKTCDACGVTEGEPLGHDLGQWVLEGTALVRRCQREGCTYAEVDDQSVAQNVDTGVSYLSVAEALNEAQAGQTIRMIDDSDEGTNPLFLRSGVTLDLGSHTLKGEFLVGLTGSMLKAERYSNKAGAAYGKLMVPQDKLIMTGAVTEKVGKNDVIPVWNGADGYVLANAHINDYNTGYGLVIDEETKTVDFAFTHVMGGSANTDFLKDGADDNALKIVIRLSWENENGVAYQDFVYNANFVGKVAGGGYNYTFKLLNYDLLNIDVQNLTVTAMFLTDSGIVSAGSVWSIRGAGA